jgi:dTMP kinase
MRKGKFIVIDGTDGSGKATQVALLVKRLRRAGYRTVLADFPRYGEKSAGLVEEYLAGRYGSAKDVGPYRASIFYACDRYAASFELRRWLGEGKVVVSNRYVTANMGHQGGKLASAAARKRYFRWLYDLEYGLFGIPKPDLNLILHVDAKAAMALAGKRWRMNHGRAKHRDIHENDFSHLRAAERAYLEIARSFPGFALVECAPHGVLMPREAVAALVWKCVKKVL